MPKRTVSRLSVCKGLVQVREDILRSENKKGTRDAPFSTTYRINAFTTIGIRGIFNFLAFLLTVRSALQVHDLNFNLAECVTIPIEPRVQKCARTRECRRAHAHFYGVTIGTGLKQS